MPTTTITYVTDVQHTEQTPVLAGLARARLLAVTVLADPAAAAPLGHAVAAGGLRVIEVTLRTPGALRAIATLATNPDLVVGAGTVVTVEQVDQAVDAGARFVVSPGFSADVVRRCQERGVDVFPGVATATEIQMALAAGVRTVKFFPAELLGGAAMVRALAAPFQSVRFIPTGGITAGNLADYLAIPNVLAIGGTWMVPPALLAAGDWARVQLLTREAVAAVEGTTGA